jgi:hypothetical protein
MRSAANVSQQLRQLDRRKNPGQLIARDAEFPEK